MKRLLLLEDDLVLQEIIEEHLVECNYNVESYLDGALALDEILKGKYDLLLLDINVPQLDGFEILEYLREIRNNIPVIFITSMTGIKSLQKGFDLGANDYLKKPFDLDELCIRIEHHLRSKFGEDGIKIFQYTFYPQSQILQDGERDITIKNKEAQILLYFIQRAGNIVTFEDLIENIWSGEESPTYATIRTYIKNLRKILGADSISNIKGAGYRLNKL